MRNRNPFKTKKFQRLQKTWSKKLEKSGFTDIEHHKGQVISDLYSRVNFKRSRVKRALEEYYSWASQAIHKEFIQNHKHNWVWYLHAQGLSPAKIGSLTGFERKTIYNNIQSLKAELKEVEKPLGNS